MDILLTDVPEEILKVIKEAQAKEKESRGIGQFSMPSTIYKIIREWSKKK